MQTFCPCVVVQEGFTDVYTVANSLPEKVRYFGREDAGLQDIKEDDGDLLL